MSAAAVTWDCTEAHQFIDRPAYADHPACRAHCRACDGCITLKDPYAGCRCGRCAPYCWPCWNGVGTSPRTACARRRLRLEQPAPSPRRRARRPKTIKSGGEHA